MKKQALIILAAMALLAVSCKKESSDPTPVARADYFRLQPGNYWIYEGYTIDTTGVATSTGKFDSAYIAKDTVMNGKTYFELHQNPYVLFPEQAISYLRDSSGYLVDQAGFILASDCNFTDTLWVDQTHPELYTGYLKMTGKDSVVTVNAGSFTSITSSLKVIPTPPNEAGLPVRYMYDVYAKGAGKIKSHNFFFAGNIGIEARLVRYGIIVYPTK